jgi:23S rRNA (cytosine1962-C5)-methyltransferase
MSADPTAVIHLKPGRARSVERRHPWIFSGAIERVDGNPGSGETVRVVGDQGRFLAIGAFSAQSQIRVRVWSFDDVAVDGAFLARRVAQAVETRRRLGLIETDGACRLIFSESDGLPGFVVDRYGQYLACQFLSAGAERWREPLLDALEAELSPRGIVERSEASARRKEGLPSNRGPVRGEPPPTRLEITSGGLRQLVDIGGGQKTGGYLDQRENRARVAQYAAGARVLDAYAYTGGFGQSCLMHGASESVLLDSSQAALTLATEQADLNGLGSRCRTMTGDVGDTLRELVAARERFDLIVLDPPKFVHSAEQVKSGARAYKDINQKSLELLRPGSTLATFSCSGHVDAALFQKIVAGAAVDARRDVQILERLSQPPDHPTSLHFPEGEYLKGLILRVVA